VPDTYSEFERFAKRTAAQLPPRHTNTDCYIRMLSAAGAVRDEHLGPIEATGAACPKSRNNIHIEALQLLAAASAEEATKSPELATARGHRVTLAYDEGERAEQPSICVLVRSPSELLRHVQNETAYLWNGWKRFEFWQFDPDGEAIGTLPSGAQISLSDFASSKVKLEEPADPTED
jgi:hypothetical protein